MSVIVPARNAARYVPRLVEAFRAQTVSADTFELLIVDDFSSDGTRELVEASGLARLVAAPRHVGVYAARNLGIDAARADTLAFTDADCIPARDWIDRGLDALDRTGADVIAGRFESPIDSRLTGAALVDLSHNYDQERYVGEGHSAGGNTWLRRRVVDSVGPFDASLLSGGDTELVRRAVGAGFRLEYAPDVVVTHHPNARAWTLVRRSFRLGFGRGQARQTHVAMRLRRGGRAYVTGDLIRARLEQLGYRPTRLDLLRIHLVRNVCMRAPLVAGNLVGVVARRFAARGRSA